jgi:hypothetical protein
MAQIKNKYLFYWLLKTSPYLQYTALIGAENIISLSLETAPEHGHKMLP